MKNREAIKQNYHTKTKLHVCHYKMTNMLKKYFKKRFLNIHILLCVDLSAQNPNFISPSCISGAEMFLTRMRLKSTLRIRNHLIKEAN